MERSAQDGNDQISLSTEDFKRHMLAEGIDPVIAKAWLQQKSAYLDNQIPEVLIHEGHYSEVTGAMEAYIAGEPASAYLARTAAVQAAKVIPFPGPNDPRRQARKSAS